MRSLASLACGGLRTTRRRVAPPRCTGFQSKDAAVACGCSYPGSALHKAGRDESRLIPATTPRAPCRGGTVTDRAPPDGSILRPRSKEELREGLRDLDRRLSRIERPAERGAAFGAFRRRPAPPDPFVSPRPSRRPLRAPSSLDGRARRPSAGRPRLAAPVAGKVSARSCRHGHPFRRDCRRSCRRRRPARGRTGQGAPSHCTSGVTPGPMTVTRCRSPTAGPRGALSGYPGGGA